MKVKIQKSKNILIKSAIGIIGLTMFVGCMGMNQPTNESNTDNDSLVDSTVKTVVNKIMDSGVLTTNSADAKIKEIVSEQCDKATSKLDLNMISSNVVSFGCVKYAVPEVKKALKEQLSK